MYLREIDPKEEDSKKTKKVGSIPTLKAMLIIARRDYLLYRFNLNNNTNSNNRRLLHFLGEN